jgi:glycosyltransferase involved in cell wall biosynthesis
MADLQTVKKRTNHHEPLKICFLTYRGNPTCGGQGIYTKRICRALKDIGHEVSVVSGPPYPELDHDIPLFRLPSLDLYNPENLFRVPRFHEFLSPVNTLEWLDFSTGGFPEPLTFSLRAYHFFRSNSNHFDVVHDNQCLSYGLLGIKKLGYPLVATIHHPITVDRNTEIKSARYPWSKLKILRWYSFIGMQKRVSRQFSHIITVSECSKKDLSREFRISPTKFRVAPNGIDTSVFYPLPRVQRNKNRLIVTTSADTPLKGLSYLLKAVASIAKKREIKLTVIGQPKRGSGVLNLIKELNLKNHLEFTGRIDDMDFAYYYALSSIAVVPSVYEGFGFPAGEAMACRIPVISTTGGALAEVVGDAGILVPPADAGALERAILDLMDNPDKREQLAEAGYQRVQQNFTWKRAAEKVVNVYREAIDANGRSE